MSRSTLLLICALWAVTLPARGETANPPEPVRVLLQIPPAEFHVIGDSIPLIWRFENVSDAPLAFLWEGCCRLNGWLEAESNGVSLPAVPPGPATAHPFARPERLEPGAARDFETFLSDWVELSGSGRLTLHGRYTGVLPQQQPRVPGGLELWRGTSATPAVQADLLTVADYLQKRAERERARRLSMRLDGDPVLLPLGSAAFKVAFTNTGTTEQHFFWPQAVSLWIVDSGGRRVAPYAEMQTAPQTVSLPAGGHAEMDFSIPSTTLWGEPFGDYKIFLDVNAGEAGPRVPSAPAPFSWQITPEELRQLVQSAAEGSEVGARNPPLRLLRTYLAELESELNALEPGGLSPAAAALAGQLQLAACLKEFAPRAGQVDLSLTVGTGGALDFSHPVLAECLTPERDALEALRSVVSVRRHLGVEFAPALEPQSDLITAGDLLAAANRIAAGLDGLVVQPRALVLEPGQTAPGIIYFRSTAVPANLVLRLSREPQRVKLQAVRRLPGPTHGSRAGLFSANELAHFAWNDVSEIPGLEEWMSDGRLPHPQTVVLADSGIRWDELQHVLRPLLQRGLHLTVTTR